MKTIFGLGVAWLLGITLVLLLCVVGAGFTVWYNYHIAVPVENSERHVTTCSMQYLTTQKAHIEDDLNGISQNNVEIASTSNQTTKQALQSQSKTNADDIYNALDASDCSRAQIIQDMPELTSFFQEYPSR